MHRQPNKRLGELLVDAGIITRMQLDVALQHQKASMKFLGAILVELGIISPEALLTALSEQFGIAIERLDVERVDWALAKKFPASLLGSGRCFPVRVTPEAVIVAVANPLDVEALNEIGRLLGAAHRVKPVLVLPEELQAAVRAYQQRALQSITSHLSNDAKH